MRKNPFINLFPVILILLLNWTGNQTIRAQTYPPETSLSYVKLPAGVSRPGYLSPVIDPTFGTQITRIGDAARFGSARPYHHYAKDQPWNSDGSLIMMEGWPAAILDGNTYEIIRTINPSGDHHIWSNTDPETIYGASANRFESQSAISGLITTLHTFKEYDKVSIGDWEGNISNDDRYAVLRCSKSGSNYVVVYDIPEDSIIATKNIGTRVPNNVAMSQSGKYVAIQWNVDGPGVQEGITIHHRDNLGFVRQVSWRGGTHYDLGYDTKGNEVSCQAGEGRGIVAVRLDNGAVTQVIDDDLMSWSIHISCRNLDRPGWLYLSDFAASYSEPNKSNYQQIFAVKIDGSGTVNSFAHVHHSTVEAYDRSPFGVPNRDGSKVMFRSDWDRGSGEIDSYVATMLPGTTIPSVYQDDPPSEDISFKVRVVPNPLTDQSSILLSANHADDYTVSVFDITGRIVLYRSYPRTRQEKIDLDFARNPAIYFLKVVNSKNQALITKLL